MKETTPERLYMMRIATIRSDDQVVPVPCYLIQMSDGTNILIDSGFPDDAESWPEMDITIERSVFDYLADLDLCPDDINVVICTHLDVDHAGQHAALTNAELIVQREHHEFVQIGDERFELAKALSDDANLRFRVVDGDTELFPGVELIESSGHVPGHQAVLIRLPETGPVLLGVDALPFDMTPFTPENRPVIPFDMDEAATRASTRKLLDIACREGVELIVYGHDEPQWQQLRVAPEWYG